MGLVKLTAGDGYTYLTRQVAAHDATERGHSNLGDYYAEKGEAPGRWAGAGLSGLGLATGEAVTEAQMKALFGEGRHPNSAALEGAVLAAGGTLADALAAGALGRPFRTYAGAGDFRIEVAKAFTDYNTDHGRHWRSPIPADIRARIRTDIAHRRFVERHQRPPADDRELAGFLAGLTRQATTAVAGYDLTFSPVKSVSALWALAPRGLATVIEKAHDAAVADTLAWIEREAAFTRIGSGAVRQVPVRGLVATAFTHRDSRAGDPDLHTHVAVSNKVQTLDGRWLALDGRVLYQANVSASEHYNTRLEAELTHRLGVEFTDGATEAGKRPVREIEGVDPMLARYWSRRRSAIEARRAELAAAFQNDHGRPPTAVEALALAQQATLETRDAKHAPRSEYDQRAAWRAEAVSLLGDDDAVDGMVRHAVGHRFPPGAPSSSRELARTVLAEVEARRATWTVWHVRAEAERQTRRLGLAPGEVEHAVTNLIDRVLHEESVRLDAPDPVPEAAALRRPDGESVYDVHGSAIYTSRRVLADEQRILDAARRVDGRRISDVRVGIALAEATANGTALNEDQAALVRRLATSGARVQLALAPAGTGKTTAMRVLAAAWVDADGWVLGLAPSAAAARELRHALGGSTDTLSKLVHSLHHLPENQWPLWMRQIGPRTLVVLDEAGQAATTELADAIDFLLARGASLRLVGDDHQLASVAAGGILRDLARTTGVATLSEVRRFTDPAEAAATLAVRQGSPVALGFYADHRRIHVGDTGSAADQAYAAWAADRSAGLDSLLLAPTRELVRQLNERARADRLADRGEQADALAGEVTLDDGTRVAVGDTVVTRRNERRLALTATDWVKNGDRWTVTAVRPDGTLRVRHLALRRTVVLPADYVRGHVQLGYAATVQAAQGQTTDTSHTVVSGQESRQLLYVALSRGRTANHLYIATAHDGDLHGLIRREALLPPTAIDVLGGILERDGSQHSATSTRRELCSPASLLHQAALRYHDALAFAAEQILGGAALTALDAQAEALVPGLPSAPAYPTLRGHLALRAVDGADAVALLADALAEREHDTAGDVAAVLDWRIGRSASQGPLPWLSALPARLASSPDWGDYLQARSNRIVSITAQVRAEADTWTPTSAPSWAQPLLDPAHAELRGDLAVWRAAYAVPDDDLRPTGPRQLATDAERHQLRLDRRFRAATGIERAKRPWIESLPDAVRTDPHLSHLADHLNALERAGLDVPGLISSALDETRALPTEVPADALWWRIVRHLGPAALPATGHTTNALKPVWTPVLIDQFGTKVAERVLGAPAWPALAAAVSAASDWTPEQLLGTIIDGLRNDEGFTVATSELCSAMVWRIAALTDIPTDPETAPADPLDDEAVPPADLHLMQAPDAPAPIDRARILELNEQASNYFASLYPRSWAPAYLRSRIRTDLLDDPRFVVGYAPPGPTSLIRHLVELGATEPELVDAGLARRTKRGHLVDAFKDRLVFPIREGDGIVGFIARRNPTKDESEYAGPKYLNTRATAAFTKGHQLYGLTEGATDLAAGATPVLVEGPLDALAVTRAGKGQFVGVAPLGTAFTPQQADVLERYLDGDLRQVAIATDPDAAGWFSAQRAFWQLAALGAEPLHVDLPLDIDPAELLASHGPEKLWSQLAAAQTFAARLLSKLVDQANDIDSPATRLRMIREAGQIIGALPPTTWASHIDSVNTHLNLPPGMLHMEVIDAGTLWTDQPAARAALRIAEIAHPHGVAMHRPAGTPHISSKRIAACSGHVLSASGSRSASAGRAPGPSGRRMSP